MTKSMELLAPAGSFEALVAAVQNGADAVYLGGKTFGARAFSANFDHDEMKEALRYCHLRNVRVYVTLNTLLNEDEFPNAIQEALYLYHLGVDAFLVQDLGLMHVLLQRCPDMEIHASTQMHIHNVEGVQFCKKKGLHRVVLARETPLEVIQEATKQGIEIEVFAYGALCTAYSGQCLMSSFLYHRSGNKGMCAQPCRMKYQVLDSQQNRLNTGEYVLSPKDLNLLNRIPELLEAGVSSLKIEGRMKRPEYIALVTKTFREALDCALKKQPYQVSSQRLEELKLLFNRGFTEGHIFHAKPNDLMDDYRPNHMGIPCGEVVGFSKGQVQVRLTQPIHQRDGLRILNAKEDQGFSATKIYKDCLLVKEAQRGDIVSFDLQERVALGDMVVKTSDEVLMKQLAEETVDHEHRRIPAKLTYLAKIGEPLKCTLQVEGFQVEATSSQPLEAAQKRPIEEEELVQRLSKIKDTVYTLEEIQGTAEPFFCPVSVINETRRALFEQMDEARLVRNRKEGNYACTLVAPILRPEHTYVEVSTLEQKEALDQRQDTLVFSLDEKLGYPLLSSVKEHSVSTPLDLAILSEMGDLTRTIGYKIANSTFNVTNSYAMEFLLAEGVAEIIPSLECTSEWLQKACTAFKNRQGFEPPLVPFVYGKRSLMKIKSDLFSRYHSSFPLTLKGFEETLSCRKNEFYTEILEEKAYNSFASDYRKSFWSLTDEDAEKVREIFHE